MRIQLTVFTLLLAVAGPAAAQSNNDVKCLLVSNLFSKAAKDAKPREVAESAKFFYAGRIYGRLNDAQLKAQMAAQQKVITPKNAGQVMNDCAREVRTAGTMIERAAQQVAPKKK